MLRPLADPHSHADHLASVRLSTMQLTAAETAEPYSSQEGQINREHDVFDRIAKMPNAGASVRGSYSMGPYHIAIARPFPVSRFNCARHSVGIVPTA